MKPQHLFITLLMLAGARCSPAPQAGKLPMLWKETIYDTCFTQPSFDGRYIVFVGWTEEDKRLNEPYLTDYGLLGMDERNSIFLYDMLEKTTTLLKTTSPEGFGVFLPQMDANNEWVYYLRQNYVTASSLMRYNINTNEEEFLTYCENLTYFKLLANGNLLFKNVKEEVFEYYPEDGGVDWAGFVLRDIEMTPEGICVKKSDVTERNLSSEEIFIDDKTLQHQWMDNLNETHYIDCDGVFVGSTSNYIESYDGWRGQKQSKH